MNRNLQTGRSADEDNIIRPAVFAQTQIFPEFKRSDRGLITFPSHFRSGTKPGIKTRPGPPRVVLLIFVIMAHLSILAVAVILSTHSVVRYDPDKVIDLLDMTEMASPPKSQPIQKPAPVSVPDAQRLQVKDETKPPVPAEPTTPATNPGENSGQGTPESFLPQSQIDTPPQIPTKQIQSKVVYPDMAQKMGLEALVILELFIDHTGKIIRISVLKDPGHGFAEAAIKAFEGISLNPAQAGGVPVAVRWRYPIRFTLK